MHAIAPPPPHLSAAVAPPPPPRPVQILDIECYRNYFLVKLYQPDTREFREFVLNAWTPLDIRGLSYALATSTIVTFNGNKYDIPMLACALKGYDNNQLKNISDAIIVRNMQPWEVEREYFATIPEYLDHIDLIEVAPGQASLKIYGGRLHCKRMQDLPIEPGAILTADDMGRIAAYCGNDLLTTHDLYCKLKDDIDLRIDLGKQYGIDLRSKSDAQIAESAFKKLLKLNYEELKRVKAESYVAPGTQFFYKPPPFIKFNSPVLQNTLAMIERSPFTIEPSGSPKMTDELANCEIKIGSSVYRLGSGGLHSSEQSASHAADAFYSLRDVDVVSYYPKIISILRMFPPQLGEVFLTIYDGWIEVRIEYKNKGDKKKAGTFKIKINGTFGKLGSKYSIMYAPRLMIQTTVTGQLSLLMLIDWLESAGISVVSANTDGIVIKCPRHLHDLRDTIIKGWEAVTGFETEANDYRALYSRDVNNYLAIKEDYTDKQGNLVTGEVKAKGAYSEPGLQKNPTNIICVEAATAYLLKGIPIETTIRGCSDIRKFVTVRAVKGGGEWVQGEVADAKATIKKKKETLIDRGWIPSPYPMEVGLWGQKQSLDTMGWHAERLDDAYMRCFVETRRSYLGKAVRWYYGRGQTGHIAYASNGNLVAKSEGAKPCMELPDVLPPDINYDWYVRETTDLLKGINCC